MFCSSRNNKKKKHFHFVYEFSMLLLCPVSLKIIINTTTNELYCKWIAHKKKKNKIMKSLYRYLSMHWWWLDVDKIITSNEKPKKQIWYFFFPRLNRQFRILISWFYKKKNKTFISFYSNLVVSLPLQTL